MNKKGKVIEKELNNKVDEVSLTKEQEAQKILQEALLKREKAFIDDYTELCKKHGMQVEVVTQLVVREVKL